MFSGKRQFTSFRDFYPYYLGEHQNKYCRRLHVIGSSITLLMLIYIFIAADWPLLLFLPLTGYGFAWLGHFGFERNKPAAFGNPIYSLIGDFVMFKDVVVGNLKF